MRGAPQKNACPIAYSSFHGTFAGDFVSSSCSGLQQSKQMASMVDVTIPSDLVFDQCCLMGQMGEGWIAAEGAVPLRRVEHVV
jgi:hypothetical protein